MGRKYNIMRDIIFANVFDVECVKQYKLYEEGDLSFQNRYDEWCVQCAFSNNNIVPFSVGLYDCIGTTATATVKTPV